MSNSLKKIFVVDDTAFMRVTLVKYLIELGFARENITEFENGRLALSAVIADEIKPDLIFSDWNMPVMSGIDFLKALRKDEQFKELPVVMITTVSEKDKIVECLQYRLRGYLLKPLNKDKLEETVKNIFDEEAAA
jgi:two-component system chemotaxis response regulator CheY